MGGACTRKPTPANVHPRQRPRVADGAAPDPACSSKAGVTPASSAPPDGDEHVAAVKPFPTHALPSPTRSSPRRPKTLDYAPLKNADVMIATGCGGRDAPSSNSCVSIATAGASPCPVSRDSISVWHFHGGHLGTHAHARVTQRVSMLYLAPRPITSTTHTPEQSAFDPLANAAREARCVAPVRGPVPCNHFTPRLSSSLRSQTADVNLVPTPSPAAMRCSCSC